jgi:hypothetical protein
MRLASFITLIVLLVAQANAKEPAGTDHPVHLIPLDNDFPAQALAGPGITIQEGGKPVGENGPLPMPIIQRLVSELHLELPSEWDALEQDMFFGRVEFQEEAAVAKRYGGQFPPALLKTLRAKLRQARAEALRRGDRQ